MKNKKDESILSILKSNKGFKKPNDWIDYAKKHSFKLVPATELKNCPSCKSKEYSKFAQYVYYSNLVSILYCKNCFLYFSNTRLNDDIISEHFENAYKDEEYFIKSRRRIFKQISNLVCNNSKDGSTVLDIGGAKGHQLDLIRKDNSKLKLTLNDFSLKACDYASKNFGLSTIHGDIKAIKDSNKTYDTLILSDVIYYEPKLELLWETLPKLVNTNGKIIFRIPNLLFHIKLHQKIFELRSNKMEKELQSKIKFLNPEHLYVFSNKYMRKKLKELGFNSIKILPSELLGNSFSSKALYYLSKSVYYLTFKKIIISPSVICIAKKG